MRTALSSLVILSGLLAATYAVARPARHVHAISEYTDISREDSATQVSELGATMQPGTTRSVRRVVVTAPKARTWTCGAEAPSLIGGSYRRCEWEVSR